MLRDDIIYNSTDIQNVGASNGLLVNSNDIFIIMMLSFRSMEGSTTLWSFLLRLRVDLQKVV